MSFNLFEDLRTKLLTVSGVTVLCGGTGTGARIWNSWPRTYATPAVVIDVVDEQEQNTLDGNSDAVIAQVDVNCRAETHAVSDDLAHAVRTALKGYAGTFDAILDDTEHNEIPESDGSTKHWYDHVMHFTMLWQEA